MNLLYGNFDFEHQLSHLKPRTLPAAVLAMNADLPYTLVAIAQPGDFIWAEEPADSTFKKHLSAIGLPEVQFVTQASQVPKGVDFVPWGWSPAVKELATKNGWRCECPESAAVATANSRQFSAGLEQEWNVGLPGAATIRSVAELQTAVNALTQHASRWVVKANFGMSARERILEHGPEITPNAVQWIQKQLAHGPVYFEPWAERIEEVAFQFTIPATGDPILEGITPLLTDDLGTYCGSRLSGESCRFATPDELSTVLAIVTRAAQRVQQIGYFGPLGIDAMLYETPDGQRRWRPLQDINARWTMGRVALGLERIVPRSKHATWLRDRPFGNASTGEELGPIPDLLPKGSKITHISPRRTRDQLVSAAQWFLVTADTTKSLFTAEAFCLSR
jgi:hypothetical protein